MTLITKKFDEAFKAEIQKKTNWHFGKPVKTRIDLEIWKKLYLHDAKNYIVFDIVGAKKEESHINSTAFTVRDIDKIIAEELDECINKFAGQTLEQVQAHFDEA
jgi:actin-like ATPase involved in cell morphogenesis